MGSRGLTPPGKKEGMPDLRNPNERMEELIPEDVEEKIDGRLKIPMTRAGRFRRTARHYNQKMQLAASKGQVEEAISIFEEEMLVHDRVLPTTRTFIILISILGRVGHISKAFELFYKMKQFNLYIDERIFTSLFNSCSNCFDKALGLEKASSLLNYLHENDIQPNLFVLKAGTKAFGVCGDLPRAFAMMDDASTRLRLDAECFNHLLMACISDKEAGFRRAVQIWGRMQQHRIRPGVYTINLLLRATRDCGVGKSSDFLKALGMGRNDLQPVDVRTMRDYLVSKDTPRAQLNSTSHRKDNNSFVLNTEQDTNNIKNTVEISSSSPSIISQHTDSHIQSTADELSLGENLFRTSVYRKLLSDGVTYKDVQTSTDISFGCVRDLKLSEFRLAMLGGAQRLMVKLDALKIEPDLRTYTQLLSCLPNDEGSEVWLLMEMEKRKCNPDIDLLNDIMVRRYRRRDYHTLKAMIPVMSSLGLLPNMRTYSALARSCKKEEDCWTLLDDMESAHLAPDNFLLNNLMRASGIKFSYKLRVMKLYEEYGIRPTPYTIQNVEMHIQRVKDLIVDAEKNDTESPFLNPKFKGAFRNFIHQYKQWLQNTDVDMPRDPWQSRDQKQHTQS